MTRVLWTSADAIAATGGTSNSDWAATGLSIDSRTTKPGDLFIALQGPHLDGNDFVTDAFARGAVAALVSRPVEAPGPLLIVPDTLQALRDLAVAARARSSARVIALTGSVGKTSTKEALRHVLSAQGETHASAASFNNHWGAPLSLALLPQTARYAIFELGMNHPGEIEPLSRMVRPHVALITNIHPVHLGPMKTLEAIAIAKAEIFAGLEPDGCAIINDETNHSELLHLHAPDCSLTFSSDLEQTDAYMEDVHPDSEGTTVRARICSNEYTYRVPVPGIHHAENSLGVLLTVSAIGGNVRAAAASYATLDPVGGRGDRMVIDLPAGAVTLIDETHNSSPVAARAALTVLGMSHPTGGGRRIAVLGDMLELGPESERFHVELAENIVSAGIDLAYLSGSNMAHLYEALPQHLRGGHAPDSTGLLPIVAGALRAGDIVLVKGSRGSQMKIIIEGLRQSAVKHAV